MAFSWCYNHVNWKPLQGMFALPELSMSPTNSWSHRKVLPSGNKIWTPKKFWNFLYKSNKTPGACTIKHKIFVIYGFRSKLVCLSRLVFLSKASVFVQTSVFVKPVKVPNNRRDTSLLQKCKISLNYESVMLYSTSP